MSFRVDVEVQVFLFQCSYWVQGKQYSRFVVAASEREALHKLNRVVGAWNPESIVCRELRSLGVEKRKRVVKE